MLFNQLDREMQKEAGLPHTYYEILVRLSEAPEWCMRMSELASRSTSSRSRISHAVDRLVEFEWVRRERCPNDKRGALAVLTDGGFAVLDRASHGHVESVRTHVFDQLSKDQLLALASVNEALVRHLQTLVAPAPDGADPTR